MAYLRRINGKNRRTRTRRDDKSSTYYNKPEPDVVLDEIDGEDVTTTKNMSDYMKKWSKE